AADLTVYDLLLRGKHCLAQAMLQRSVELDPEDERSPVGEDCQAYGIQTRKRRRKNMATIEGRKSVAESRSRHQIPKRHRGHQNVGSPRRLIDLVTQSPA